MKEFKKVLEKFQSALNNIKKHNIDLNKKIDLTKSIYDFKEKKSNYYLRLYQTSFDELKQGSLNLKSIKINDLIQELEKEYKNNNLNKINEILSKITPLIPTLKSEAAQKINFEIKNIPEDIKDDLKTDLRELENCFSSECHRSCVILCGRLLETSLHRKYYEATKEDILEKNPGIGLGKLIAKLDENNIKLDPGLTQQIHLINQVRIFSVHKKQKAFYPSKQQTQAMILYTLDVLDKLFK